MMTVKDFIEQDIEIDVYDTMTDDIAIAFVGPARLTEAGAAHFSPVLDMQMMIKNAPGLGVTAYVVVDGDDWEKKQRQAKEFFDAAAGYCPADNYKKWFKD